MPNCGQLDEANKRAAAVFCGSFAQIVFGCIGFEKFELWCRDKLPTGDHLKFSNFERRLSRGWCPCAFSEREIFLRFCGFWSGHDDLMSEVA
jgi:hypothetical protein